MVSFMKVTLTVSLEAQFEVEVSGEKLKELEQALPVDVAELEPSLQPCYGLEDQMSLRSLRHLRFRHLAITSRPDATP